MKYFSILRTKKPMGYDNWCIRIALLVPQNRSNNQHYYYFLIVNGSKRLRKTYFDFVENTIFHHKMHRKTHPVYTPSFLKSIKTTKVKK